MKCVSWSKLTAFEKIHRASDKQNYEDKVFSYIRMHALVHTCKNNTHQHLPNQFCVAYLLGTALVQRSGLSVICAGVFGWAQTLVNVHNLLLPLSWWNLNCAFTVLSKSHSSASQPYTHIHRCVRTGLMTFPWNQSEFAVFIWNLLALCCYQYLSQHAPMKPNISQQSNSHCVFKLYPYLSANINAKLAWLA